MGGVGVFFLNAINFVPRVRWTEMGLSAYCIESINNYSTTREPELVKLNFSKSYGEQIHS